MDKVTSTGHFEDRQRKSFGHMQVERHGEERKRHTEQHTLRKQRRETVGWFGSCKFTGVCNVRPGVGGDQTGRRQVTGEFGFPLVSHAESLSACKSSAVCFLGGHFGCTVDDVLGG